MLKNLKIKKYPWQIYAFWFANFVLGLEFVGSILVPFFTEWGGLNQTQIQFLQSWFMFWIFVFEVPTGVLGDVKGTKYSVILGTLLVAVGHLIYITYPHMLVFLLAEFTMALGVAFTSGSNSAWLYDTAQQLGLKKEYRSISVAYKNAWLVGMLIASLASSFVVQHISLQMIFALGGLTAFLNALVLGFIPAVAHKKGGESFSPDYKKVVIDSTKVLKNNRKLIKYAVFVIGLSSTAYFVIWLYQTALGELSVDLTKFGFYRVFMLIGQIVSAFILSKLIDSKRFSPRGIGWVLAILVGGGFISAFLLRNISGVVLLVGLAGGVGLQVRTIYSKEINDEIESSQRATVLSFIGMARRVVLTVANPLVGYAVDSIGVFITLGILGVLSLFTGFVLPKEKGLLYRRKLLW